MTNRNVSLPPLSVRATPQSLDEKARTVDVMFSSGVAVRRYSWSDGAYNEELSLDPAHVRMQRLNQGAPFLANHNGYDVARTLGVVERAWIENGKGYARVRFASAETDPEADKVFRKIKEGIITSVSVGYRVHKLEKISGGEGQTPTFRATDWEPHEISAVALPAESGAGFRSAEPPQHNPCVFVTRMESDVTDEELKKQEAEAAAKREAEIRADAVRAERERASGIESICKRHKLDEKFTQALVASNSTLEQARDQVLEELARLSDAGPPSQRSNIEVGATDNEKFARNAAAWLFQKSGTADMIREAQKRGVKGLEKIDLDSDGEVRGMSMLDLARESLERTNVKTRGLSKEQLAGRAFTMTRSSGLAGISDFPVLLENTLGKILLAAYGTVEDTWSQFCGKTFVPDFRPSPRYRTGSLGVLDVVNEHGEYKNAAIPDGQKTAVSVVTKGRMIAVSRQMIINDDMGAFTDLLQKLGRAARLSIEADVYALLNANSGLGPTQTDSQPFFHSNRANVNATGSAIGVPGLDADRVVMAQQKDISGNEYLSLRPSVLLVPIGLGAQARVLNSAEYDITDTKFQKPNVVRGLFARVIDTPRLTHATRRYLFADPSATPAIMVAFLEGQGETPTLETKDGWRTDGTEMKVRLDYQAQMFDPKGAVTNAGA